MSKIEKLLNKLKAKPKDFTYQEARTLLEALGFYEYQRGKTSGSKVAFINKQTKLEIKIHKPHPGNILKPYQIELILEVIRRLEEKQ